MLPSLLSTLALSSFIFPSLAFDANSKDNVAVYWGQSSAGFENSLADYCQSSDANIFILAFLVDFPDMDINLSSACSGMGTCSQVAADIQTCQDEGKIVLLSLGGSVGSYGFTSDDEAEEFAQSLWDTFGGGSSTDRPFGDSIVDGFDFDIENNNPTGYAALATSLRSKFEGASKQYYLSAAPQCPYPDASVGDMLEEADIDFAFIQFYNNYCDVTAGEFNWDTWVQYAEDTSPNKDIKLFLGLPGSSTAAGSGYVSDLSTLQSTISSISSSSNFGGVALWDASQAFSNELDGEAYVAQVKSALESDVSSSGTSSSSSAESTLTKTYPSTTSTTSTSSTTAPSSSSSSSSPSSFATSSSPAAPTTSSAAPSSPAAPTTSSSLSSAAGTTSSSLAAPTSAAPSTEESGSSSSPAASSTQVSSPAVSTSSPSSSSTASIPVQSSSQEITSAPSSSRSATTLTPSSSASSSGAHASAVSLNEKYAAGMTDQGSCSTTGDLACSSSGSLAICDYGSWVIMSCAAGTTCYAYDYDNTVFTGCNYISSKQSYLS